MEIAEEKQHKFKIETSLDKFNKKISKRQDQ